MPDENTAREALRAGKNYIKLALTLAIIGAGLAGRSSIDKILAQRGGAELVAAWAQLASVVEIVSGVALAGVGAGLSVLAAQTSSPERQQLFLRRALRAGLAVSLPVAIVVALVGWQLAEALGGEAFAPASVVLAAIAGWIAITHGSVNSLWLGQQRRGAMLALAAASAAVAVAAAALAPRHLLLEALIVSQALPATVYLLAAQPSSAPARADDRALHRFILPGVAIGILSPLSALAVRSLVGDALSWHDAGVLQALWRVADWICVFASGVLAVLYLPRFAAAHPAGTLPAALRQAAKAMLVPCAVLFLAMFAFHQFLLETLYDSSFAASALATGLIFAGSLARIVAWIPLFGLYAATRTRAIALGEFLSLPLFALLVLAAGDRLTLEAVGAFWLAAYCAYAAFNFWALRRL